MIARDRRWQLVGVVASCLLLAACGSQVPPKEFVGAQGGVGNLVGDNAAGPGGTGTTDGGAGGATSNGGTGGGSTGGGATGGGSTGGGSTGGGSTGGGSTGGGSTRGGSSGRGSTGGGSSGRGSSGGGNSTSATGGVKAGSCAGFKNAKGISASTIKIANVADLSGPVPGLFKGIQQAVQAYVAYFNATSNICGRKLALESLDSQTSPTGDQQAATTACSNDFAMVGSFGAFDDGGAQTVSQCGIPDLRAAVTESDRLKSPVVYSAQSLNVSFEPAVPPDYYKNHFSGVASKAAFVYLNAGAAKLNADSEVKAWTARGFHFVYTAGIPVTETNYTGYVAKMQAAGVKYVQYTGAYQEAVQLKKAMNDQGFKPLFVMDPVAYDPGFVQDGGSDVDGTHIWINSALFEQKASNPEMQTYLSWLKRVAPNANPNYFGLFAWAAAKLFVEQAIKLGGKLNRQSLLSSYRGIDNFTGNGLFGPQHVGAKKTAGCYQFIVLKNGKWQREGPSGYTCGTTVPTGVG